MNGNVCSDRNSVERRSMQTQQITIRVTPEAASLYECASDEERRKLDALMSLRLSEARQPCRSLEEIMHDATEEARARGLTEDALDEILNE